MLQKMKYVVGLLLAGFVLAGCAKIMPLTGGEEDKDPPAYRSSKPDTFALNFRGKTVVIKFDEYINLKDPTREILISPPVYPAPDFSSNGQDVRIKFKDSLLPDITYVVQFGKAIEDITEANVATGYSFVFSTGSFLDSGSVKGTLVDAFTGKPSEGFKVMLYQPTVTDSFPYKDKPFYLTYTDAAGAFKLGNLRKGQYRIFALKEDDNNSLYDRPGEQIAFMGTLVSADDSVGLNMVSFTEETGKMKFVKAKAVSAVRTDFYFLGKAGSVRAKPYFGIPDSLLVASEFNTTQDTLTLWHYPVPSDSFAVFLNAPNYSDTAVLRVNRAALQAKATGGGRNNSRGAVATGMVGFNAANNLKFSIYSVPALSFTEPLAKIDTSLIHLLADSIQAPFRLVADSVSPRKYNVLFEVSEKKKYALVCDSAAFTGISGKVSTKTSYTFAFRPKVEYGSSKIVYEDSVLKYPKIWELLKDDKSIRVTFGPANLNNVRFDKLEPGSYRLRLILDSNGNGKWDTGNYMSGEQPEKVIYMTEAIELKPGWDSEVIWKLVKSRLRKN